MSKSQIRGYGHTVKKAIAPLVVLIAAGMAYIGLVATKPALVSAAKEPMPITVRALEVVPQSRQLMVISQGNIQPRVETHLHAQVDGEVKTVAPQLVTGGEFLAGDRLLSLDDRDFQIALTRAGASLDRAKAEYRYAREEYARIQSLHDQALASIAQRQQAERAFAIANANVKDAQATHERAELDLTRTVIHAPFNGRVRAEYIDEGQYLQKGAAIATLYDTDRLEVRLPIADAQLAYLPLAYANTGVAQKNDAPATVVLSARYAGQAQTWTGTLQRTEGDISSTSRYLHVIAEVTQTTNDNGVQLPVGLFVEAKISGKVVDALVSIPRTALRADNRVMVIDSSDRLHFRSVVVYKASNEEILLSSGLDAGERINVSPLQFVVEGMSVRVIE